MSDCHECGHAVYQHGGPGQACNVLLTPGERCRCNHFSESGGGRVADLFAAAKRTGDCFNIDGDPEQLVIFVKLAAQKYASSRTDENFRLWREYLSELMLSDHVDERERLRLMFEYCQDIGPDVDFRLAREPRWNLED